MSIKLSVRLHYYATILDLIHIVQRVFTYLIGRWQTSSVVEGYHFTIGGIEGRLVCARPFMERVNIGLKEKPSASLLIGAYSKLLSA